jgi:hypothetical protein
MSDRFRMSDTRLCAADCRRRDRGSYPPRGHGDALAGRGKVCDQLRSAVCAGRTEQIAAMCPNNARCRGCQAASKPVSTATLSERVAHLAKHGQNPVGEVVVIIIVVCSPQDDKNHSNESYFVHRTHQNRLGSKMASRSKCPLV